MNSIIVIPTYNEKDNIQLLTERIFNVLPEVKMLIVDDNSPDGTGIIAEELSRKYKRIKVLHREKKEGLGKAYIAGFKKALEMNPDYIIQMDADLSHDPKYIPIFLKEIESFDIVLGSRFLNRDALPLNVSILSLWAKYYANFMLGLIVSDPLGGFKCFRRKVIEGIGLDQFVSSGFIFQAEFIYRAWRKGFSIKEVPIVFDKRRDGLSKKTGLISLEAFLKIILLKIKRIRFKL